MTALETALIMSSVVTILGLAIGLAATLCSSKASSPAFRIGSVIAVVGIVSLCVTLAIGMLSNI